MSINPIILKCHMPKLSKSFFLILFVFFASFLFLGGVNPQSAKAANSYVQINNITYNNSSDTITISWDGLSAPPTNGGWGASVNISISTSTIGAGFIGFNGGNSNCGSYPYPTGNGTTTISNSIGYVAGVPLYVNWGNVPYGCGGGSASIVGYDSEAYYAAGYSPTMISFANIGNGSTTSDFPAWSVNWTGTPPYGTADVYYGQSSSTLSYHDSVSFSPFVSVSPLPISKSQSLWYIPLSIPQTWYAQAVITGATSSVFSDIITFYVDPNYNQGVTSSTLPSATTNCQVSSSSFLADPVGNIQNGICNAFAFLFIPNSVQIGGINGDFNSLKTSLANKPPFGYLAGITTILGSFHSSSSSISIVNSSTTSAFSDIFSPIDLGIASLLWVLFGFFIFHRARTIEL
jgi:hypothetical protein